MTLRPRAIVLVTALAAFAVFCVVQDRVTAAGARHAVTIDEIMRPAVDQSVHDGLLWGSGVLVAGLGMAGAVARGRR